MKTVRVCACTCPRVVPVHLSALSGPGTRLFFSIRRRCVPSTMISFDFLPLEASEHDASALWNEPEASAQLQSDE